ncbi:MULTISPECIES: phage baseplate assembly protein V [Pantoea]|jgi:phage baseplate assembly protein V|uniref:Phage baseplate assembly protein n=1 Tax=Pantoea brenneri TaxID=472694 RepID=A0A7Y6TTY0_9GAMM|nr:MULTISPECIES: phage baseplate assembly protein V [Pantoea]MBZ6397261.1 phage baseplate assembly protein V [Pantoea sp.]MBZ6440481.1 phage baseplate assembly protein V [Pantoea sp.]NUY43784.1 phage baseplate assembly protein [Pantoea brenneri]NUY51339.1 phage baseplate assembly protein [Pantoea brenneri]NUY61614.1 phage baseplate assembly protein [Pantoea brenneri]
MANPFSGLSRGLSNLLARAVVRGLNTATKCQMLQIEMAGGEGKSDIEHMEPYGFTAAPILGAEAIAAYFDGDRSHGVVLVVSDRRYRIKGLTSGEVAVYDDLGQSVMLTRSGIVVDGAGKPITFTNAPKARFEMDIEATGEIKDKCDSGGLTMSAMRVTYNGHTHEENGDGGGTTDATTQKMVAS